MAGDFEADVMGLSGCRRSPLIIVIPAQAGIRGPSDALRNLPLTLALSPKGRGD